MTTIGTLALGVALLACIYSMFALPRTRTDPSGAARSIGIPSGYLATFIATGALTVANLIIVAAFFGNDFTLMYVAENHSTDVSSLAWLYKLSGLWAGREGSLLFWAWLLALFASWIAYRRMDIADKLSNAGLAVTNLILALFTAGMMLSEPNNPFKASPAAWLGPNGELLVDAAMNPLLQHWAMILHPPTLFIGYAGLTIPFAFAIAALIVNDGSDAWVRIVDRITVFSWLFLGAGIGLGSVWAYVVLGWGGYWAWDPVENASLLPWLTGVGLIHSFTIYRRRGGFKRWTVMNAAVTFALVILGTFITRSGVVQSVHAFEKDPVSLVLFLSMIIGAVASATVGLLYRWDAFAGKDEFESFTSKEAAYYFNNVIMLMSALIVAYLTVSPALPLWLPLGGQSMSATAYDLIARPLGVMYAFIIAVCPILVWRMTDAATFWNRVRTPLAGAFVLFTLLTIEWWVNLRPVYSAMVAEGGKNARAMTAFGPEVIYSAIALSGFLAASLLISNTTWLFIDGARKRAAAKNQGMLAALGDILFKARTRSGGYLAHIGMGIILIGLVGSSMYVRDVRPTVADQPGATFTVSDYTFTYKSTSDVQQANGDTKSVATFGVSRNGRQLGDIAPGLTRFARQQQTRLDAAVMSEPLRDIFVVWEGTQGGQLSMNVKINPLIGFSWGGFALLLLGAALAAWPKSGR
ncbi:MAG: cytochrome C assembly protein [Actinobacteria bacterium HGW-Actinobacteria-9]|nr:MAG: cytochrome C assembly protein [Actinobacteria bacterium HGW-Actinobacteria-9]